MPTLTRFALPLASLALVTLAACSKDAPASTGSSGSAPAGKPAAHITGDNYKVDTSSTCASGECTATIRLEATNQFHINEAYPYRFKANPQDGVTFEGKDTAAANVFSKEAGDFARQTEKVAVMTVKLKADKPQTVTGVFKMSVCSAANCELEQPDVAIDVAP
jgi:hypothetical protein